MIDFAPVPEAPTVPRDRIGFPVRTLKVEVVAGPDTGKCHDALETDSITIGSTEGNDLILSDPTVSRYHLELRRRDARWLVIDHGSTNGTVIGPVVLRGAQIELTSAVTLEIGETLLRVADGEVVVVDLGPDGIGDIIGRATSMRRLMASIERVASHPAPVVVLGESGTGKELVARAIHDLGPRRSGPFVTLDCGAMAPNLFASELFGHERGAFTGAERRHVGAFERAEGGTLFLDEIGELPPSLQPALLGALERRRIRRLGGTEEIPVDVRIVTATHRDLRSAVNSGAFRLDLYYRIGVVLIRVPPLRERSEDIPLLVQHFLGAAGFDGVREMLFSADSLASFMRYDWPGNVRELRNFVEATLATGEPPPLGLLDALPSSVPPPAISPPGAAPRTYKEARAAALREFEARYVTELLARTGGNVRRASREASMDRTYLKELLRRYNVR